MRELKIGSIISLAALVFETARCSFDEMAGDAEKVEWATDRTKQESKIIRLHFKVVQCRYINNPDILRYVDFKNVISSAKKSNCSNSENVS